LLCGFNVAIKGLTELDGVGGKETKQARRPAAAAAGDGK